MNNLFDNLKELEELYLNYNNLSDFNVSNKTLFYKLRKLDLNHNNLSKFNFENLETLTDFCEIDLSHNQFTEFKFLYFRNSQMPNILRRKENRLKFILNDNPIICDCNVLELVQYIKKKTESYINDVWSGIYLRHFKCKNPDNLYDRLLSTLNTTELICNIEKDCPEGCKLSGFLHLKCLESIVDQPLFM